MPLRAPCGWLLTESTGDSELLLRSDFYLSPRIQRPSSRITATEDKVHGLKDSYVEAITVSKKQDKIKIIPSWNIEGGE